MRHAFLLGAHTLGRAKPTRSGFGKDVTKYTKDGPGKPGGSSWTPEWLKFDNSYFKAWLPILDSAKHQIHSVLPSQLCILNATKLYGLRLGWTCLWVPAVDAAG